MKKIIATALIVTCLCLAGGYAWIYTVRDIPADQSDASQVLNRETSEAPLIPPQKLPPSGSANTPAATAPSVAESQDVDPYRSTFTSLVSHWVKNPNTKE